MKITKKLFKEEINYHTYSTGNGVSVRAIFFDYSNNVEAGVGYKFMLASFYMNKAELINAAYDWMINGGNPSFDVHYAIAPEDKFRFKIPLSGNQLLNIQSNISLKMFNLK